jgi:hypothetical protein
MQLGLEPLLSFSAYSDDDVDLYCGGSFIV